MVTVLEGILPMRSVLFCAFFGGGEDSKQMIFIKKCFVFMVESVWSRKVLQNRIDKFCQERSKVADDVRPGVEVVETTVKRLLCCGFQRTGKTMGQVYQCWWRICREINVSFFFRFAYHVFYVL
jgi:hypothetical protein